MEAQYERSYTYKGNAEDHETLTKALQYVSKHEEDGDCGNAVRKLLNAVLRSKEKQR